MRWILLGVVLGLLLLYPTLLSVVAAILSKPALVAFGLGLAARPHLPRVRGWKP